MAAAKSPPIAEPQSWPKPSKPWERVHIDYAGPIEGHYFLIVVDALSKWPEIVKTSTTTAMATISILRNIFARFGMPRKLVSDNGAQFTSEAFSDFCIHNGIEHVTTAPFHPQSNGQAERFVDTFKRALRKIRTDSVPLEEAQETFLLSYRSTPHPGLDGRTPADIMFGRNIRTSLELLRPPSSLQTEPAHPQAKEPYNGRQFRLGDPVFAKMFHRNTWKWIAEAINSPGSINPLRFINPSKAYVRGYQSTSGSFATPVF
ncbi:uncharacterized protein K02A2.6-like [Anopheles moucheti]|uniref:uncharacterized protein K02A2.6-like n=1 Tax=Anopheles moucheti TaxID=186751 RepID=UPI0022F05C0D|nr:uncharacterized protein K02A2.6-like [Anopheles moucheti]XP_052903099.1 uncharacterized protein K02A2.6-like [Anopheles moucheti]